VIVTYTMQLSHAISLCLEKMYVMGQEEKIAAARLRLYWAARLVLGSAMKILGLTPLERM